MVDQTNGQGRAATTPTRTGAVADAATRQAALLASMQAGDIVFFKTASATTFFDLDTGSFDDFPVLAAFAQGLPYVLAPDGNLWAPGPASFKPWHHVAICTGRTGTDPSVVQFVQSNQSGTGHPEVELAEGPLTVPAGQTIDVLRPPGGLDVAAMVAKARAQVTADHTEYATIGLLAFALATIGRMLCDQSRVDTLRRAYGAHVRARQIATAVPVESCTTAAAKAIEVGLGAPLALSEPPAPDPVQAGKLLAVPDNPYTQMIERLLARVDGGAGPSIARMGGRTAGELRTRLPSTTDALAGFADTDVLTARQLVDAVASSHVHQLRAAEGLGLPPVDGSGLVGTGEVLDPVSPPGTGVDPSRGGPIIMSPYSPGPETTTSGYLANLELAVEAVMKAGLGGTTLEQLGKADMLNPGLDADHLVLSPAMLWDALTTAHFSEV